MKIHCQLKSKIILKSCLLYSPCAVLIIFQGYDTCFSCDLCLGVISLLMILFVNQWEHWANYSETNRLNQANLPLAIKLWSGDFILQIGVVHNSSKPLSLGFLEMFTCSSYQSCGSVGISPAIFVLKFAQSISDYHHLIIVFSQFFFNLYKNLL